MKEEYLILLTKSTNGFKKSWGRRKYGSSWNLPRPRLKIVRFLQSVDGGGKINSEISAKIIIKKTPTKYYTNLIPDSLQKYRVPTRRSDLIPFGSVKFWTLIKRIENSLIWYSAVFVIFDMLLKPYAFLQIIFKPPQDLRSLSWVISST